jgi:hypothetical protein
MLTHLERRKIQGRVLIPMVRAFEEAFGVEQASAVALRVIQDLARPEGEAWTQQFGDDLEGLRSVAGVWAGGGSLELEMLEEAQERLSCNVTCCRYAESYRELGLPELGYVFHCNRDFAIREGRSTSG